MANSLVIVESPAKVKTIKKYLGKTYEVSASNGHVRDLPKSRLGIDIENDFEPMYITIRGKGELLAKLRKEAKKADKIYLATDPDREGEAICWHFLMALKLEGSDKQVYRISFNEITKKAIKEAIKNPKNLDMNLVDAQQARRVLDRMVGYLISPILWEKVKRGLSAGRVQSVALRMICDREAQISEFVPEEYWTLDALFDSAKKTKKLSAGFYGKKSKINITNEKECNKIIKDLTGAKYRVGEIKQSKREKKAPLPFTTSTLQQEAGKVLNFSTQKTMRLAQQLYEGLDIKGYGTTALITYLRTDSTRVSDDAVNMAREYILAKHGEEFLQKSGGGKLGANKIQDAHEAIRPTDINIDPFSIKDLIPRDLYRLYNLIWKRFLASRMSNAIYATTSVKILANDYVFNMSGQSLKFAGYMSVYIDEDEESNTDSLLLGLKEGDELKLSKLLPEQHFTKPPAHYTEASLVKAMEEQGIGRPSTYAPTISTILARHYVTKEQKNLYVTELGQVVNDMMVNYFSSIVDKDFTANMELLLDSVGEGNTKWKTLVENFYPDLDLAVKRASKELEEVTIADEISDVICDNCGKNMVIKYGPHGKFLACPGFPECRNTKPYFEKIGVPCPKCGKEVVIKKTKKGRIYYGCEDSTGCDFMSWNKPATQKCKKCGSYMLEKGNKLVCSSENCGFVEIKAKN